MDEHKAYWFRARRFGFGWTPNTWQGWAVTAAWAALLVGGTVATRLLAPRGLDMAVLSIAVVAALIVVLFAVCRAKGEPLRWRWGK